MDFLKRHEKTLKPGNLAFTLILIVSALGLNAYLYTKLGGNTVGNNNIIKPGSSDTPPMSLFYTGKNYDLIASTVGAVVSCGVVTGALLAKINNDFFASRKVFESTFLFITVLTAVILFSIMITPREENGYTGLQSDEQDDRYEAAILSLISILLGIICVTTGMAKEYTVLGTTFWFMMTCIALALTANSYGIATDRDNVDATLAADDKLYREFNDNEKSCALAAIVFLSIVAFLGFVHFYLDGQSFSKLTGTNYRLVSTPYKKASSPRRSSPRRSSPRRKLTSLKPKRK